ncbi:MAG TPA: serine/threonine-protein kinase, partial [Terriglobia bacterium]|nr:serine/threonine-protein kinase [Terriglobia bacterium]
MTATEQVGEIRKLFEAASESEGADREALLREAGKKDRNIRQIVEQMLEAESVTHSILDQPLGVAASAPPAAPIFKEGDTVGAYRILRKIGEGGMSAVYLAERDSEKFAIKNILVTSPDFFRRFLQEETILRSLRHPHIARLVDSGRTENKVPYLVMEYVDGEPIHRYCKRDRLSTNDRIALFRQVCAAVVYLHQHLVVHRDLKPGNILVTSDGSVKLLDFGIAKLLPGHRYAASAALTSAGVMTPDYASPEQIRGLPVSTLTDVYALGVLLYELLTGVHPFADA